MGRVMKCLSAVVVGSLALAGCGAADRDAGATSAPSTVSPTRQSFKDFQTLDPVTTPTSPATQDETAIDLLEVARADMYAANTISYVFTFAAADGRTLERETGTVQLRPYLLAYTRIVGSRVEQVRSTAEEYWSREGAGCWTHHVNTGPPYGPPGPVVSALRAVWRNTHGHTLLVSAGVPLVVAVLGTAAREEFDIPASGSRGIVELRATVDDSGRFTAWQTRLADIVVALEKVGAHPSEAVKHLDATLSTRFSHLGDKAHITAPDDVCQGTTV